MTRHDDEELLDLGRRIAAAHDELADRSATLAAARAGLLARRRTSRTPLVLGLLAAAVAAGVGIAVTRPVGLSIEGRVASRAGERVPENTDRSDGSWVTAGDEPAFARFSEGSSVRVEPGSSVRVLSRDALGARLSVEHGAADVDLRPGLLSRWEVEAGPFQITGSAARYRVEWHPDTGRARVQITAGSVFVSNPCGSSRRLGANEEAFFGCQAPPPKPTAETSAPAPVPTLAENTSSPVIPPSKPAPLRVADAPDHAPRRAIVPAPSAARPESLEVLAAPTLPLPPPNAPPAALTGEPGNIALPAVASAAPAAPKAPAVWRELVLQGDYTAALGSLGPEGMASVLADGSEDDVTVLADACRFTGQVDGAQRALTTLRRRFPKSAAARTAAFHLGRLALDKQNAPATAAIWFKKYLQERQSPALAEEAQGLLFQSEDRAGDAEAAALHAAEYLERYPAGIYRRAALALVPTPPKKP